MSAPDESLAARMDAHVQGLLPADEAAEVEARIAAGDPETVAAHEAARRRRSALAAALPPAEPPARLVPETLAAVAADAAARARRWRSAALAFVGCAAALAFLLAGVQWYGSTVRATPSDLQVFGQSALLADAPASLRVRFTNGPNAPLAGVPVEVRLRDASGRAEKLAEFTTDAAGTAPVAFKTPDWPEGSYTLEVAARAPSGTEQVRKQVTLRRSAKLLLATDKPVYQPGQVIRLRSLALRLPDRRPAASVPATFTITDPKGNVVFKASPKTSDFGLAWADCELARECLEGAYTVKCNATGVDSSLTVQVQPYVLPKFKLALDTDRPYYLAGQDVTLTASARYFHGKPVAGGTLRLVAKTEEPVPTTLFDREVPADADGKAAITFRLPPALAGRPERGGDAGFTVAASLRDAAGQEQTAGLTRSVARKPLKVEVWPEGGQLVQGIPNTVYVHTSTPDGRPAAVELSATATGVAGDGASLAARSSALGVGSFVFTPAADSVGLMLSAKMPGGETVRMGVDLPVGRDRDDFLVRLDKAVYDGGDTLKLTALGAGSEPVFLDFVKDGQTVRTESVPVKDGTGTLAFDLPPEWAGTLQLCAWRYGPDGVPVKKVRTVYVRPAGELSLTATADKPEYRPGETATITFGLTDRDGKPVAGALSIAAVDEAVFSVLEQLPGMERTFFLLEKQLLEPVYAIYPSWEPDLPRGQPVPADDREVFNQALFARTAQAIAGGGFQRQVEADAFAPAAFGVASGPTTGPHTLAADTLGDKVREATRFREKVRDWSALGWVTLVLGSMLVVWAGSLIWVWQYASTQVASVVTALWVGTPLALGAFLVVAVTFLSHESRATFGGVAAMLPEAAAGKFPPGPKVANAGPDAAPADDAPRVRSNFPETLLWLPQHLTDANGKAVVELPAADSITTWRLAASAVSADGRLGGSQTGVRVFQPFFVEPNLPVSLTRGDEVSLPVVVSNYLKEPQSVAVTLPDADWYDRAGPATQTLDLGPDQVRAVSFRVKVKKVGTHKLTVTAKSDRLGDGVERPVEVVPDGRRIEQVVNGQLTPEGTAVTVELPKDAIEGSGKLVLKLHPSAFSQLAEGLENVFQMPSGCFEQTSSTTYPNVLALDYLKRTGKSAPAVEAKARQYIHLGYQRLISFEVSGGGFEWFGHSPANVRLSAYGLMEFEDMAKVYDVDRAVIDRTRRWLLSKQNSDGSWDHTDGLHAESDPASGRSKDLARYAQTAYVAWAVYGADRNAPRAEATRTFLLGRAPSAIDDPYLLALVCNALLALDTDGPSAGPYLDRLESLRRTEGKEAYWPLAEGRRTAFYGSGTGGSAETTALAILALHQARRGGTGAGLNWLVKNKDARGTWHSTQATVLALRALLAAGTAADDKERRIELSAGEFRQTIVVTPDQAEVMRTVDLSEFLKAGTLRLELREPTGGGTVFQAAFRYHVPESAAPPRPKDGPLAVTLDYDRTDLKVGQVLTAKVTVANRQPAAAPMVMLDLPVPPGFAPDPADFARMVKEGTIEKFQQTPRQVIVYLRRVPVGEPVQLTYRLRATLPVSVAVPPARAWEYYDPDKQAATASAALKVAE